MEIQQLVARLPYGVDMNADDGAAYASGFTPDGTFACVLPDTGAAAASGLLGRLRSPFGEAHHPRAAACDGTRGAREDGDRG